MKVCMILFLAFGMFSPGLGNNEYCAFYGCQIACAGDIGTCNKVTGQCECPRPLPFNSLLNVILKREITNEKKIKTGNFAKIYKGTWNNYEQPISVAVKKEKFLVNKLNEILFHVNSIYEITAMRMLENLPNIVQFYGISYEDHQINIILEYMENGSLLNFVEKHKKELKNNVPALLQLCRQVCNGMIYMEEKNLIHRDLRARNCLVGKNNELKISDFGLTRPVGDHNMAREMLIPDRIAAPEIHQDAQYSSKSDVWAFGIVMWEVFNFGKHIPKSDALKGSLKIPKYCPYDIYEVMRRCWSVNPNQRPTFRELGLELVKLHSKYVNNYF